jgi:competence protein ComEC
VAHHGSADQDEGFLAATTPAVALVSVGEDNGYGHPDLGLLTRLRADGVHVARTDTDGDVAVVVTPSSGRGGRPDALRVVTRGSRP